jgi:hypothetical protein
VSADDEFDELAAGLDDVSEAAVDEAERDWQNEMLGALINLFELRRRIESDPDEVRKLDALPGLRHALGQRFGEQSEQIRRLLGL